jgi:hypothetical protein
MGRRMVKQSYIGVSVVVFRTVKPHRLDFYDEPISPKSTKTEAVFFFETLVSSLKCKRLYNAKNEHRRFQCTENIKPHLSMFLDLLQNLMVAHLANKMFRKIRRCITISTNMHR